MLYKKMKTRYLVLLLLVLPVLTYGQNNNPEILAKNKVSEIKKFQKVHGFIDNNDTCLIDVIRLDERGNTIYHKIDFTCIGWHKTEESIMKYEKDRLISMKTIRDGDHYSTSEYTYGKYDEPEKIVTFFVQTNDSMVMSTKYFRTIKGRMDSSITMMILQDGTIQTSQSTARYNKDGEVVQLYTLDQDGKPLQMVNNEIDDNNLVKSVAYSTYGPNESFTQTFYEYNEDKSINNTVNTVNQRQEYIYSKDGLISNILSYNPKGALEIEYIYTYSFYK